ncbi:sensor histidine kinase [Promicromonospora sp. NPDC052451]|uniref:sensor histidine kinase n=1 Tax=Promicromonospora sp. NPDC052451 TaxID=3364407 RepID=UPI0037C83904
MHITGRGAAAAQLSGDVALGLVLAGTLLLTATALAASWGGSSWVLGLCTGTVAGALALLRRRHRFGTALAGLGVAAVAVVVARLAGLPGEPSPATALALAVLVASAVRVLPAGQATTVAGGGLVVVVGSWLAAAPFTSDVSVVPTVATAAWLCALAAGLLGRLLVARREAAVDRVRRDERLAVARELHDVVAHHITGIVVQAQAAQLLLARGGTPPGSPAQPVADAVAGIESAGAEALTSLRRVVGLLRDADDASPVAPGPEALTVLVDRFETRGPRVDLRLPDDATGWPPEVTTTVYRVVQESLTNVTRHAPHARAVSVTVERVADGVRIEVSDDAPARGRADPDRGHRPGTGQGYGLVGMRERVEALDGTLAAGPRPDGGWSVVATLPTGPRPARPVRATGQEEP